VQASESASQQYQQFCARCHGSDYRGTSLWRTRGIPDFTSGAWQRGQNDAQLLVAVREGKGSQMPAFGDQVSVEQARSLVVLIREANATRSAPAETGPSDFARQFAALQQELKNLRKQFRDLEKPSLKSSEQAD
jgi:mono/diheme cytochrome c family protein